MRILANLRVSGTVEIDTLNNAATDTDVFLVADNQGIVKYRTGAEILSDINAVPYTGATSNVNLGEYGLTSGYLGLDLTPTNTPTTQGTMYWDDNGETVALIMNGTIQKVGEDTFFHVQNMTGSTIPKGTAVRFAGTTGASGKLLIAPFLANGTYPSQYFMGITSEDILNGANGKVYHFGKMRNVDTSAYTDGDILYCSTTVAGGFQTSPPVAPNNIIIAAAVIHAASNGTLMIRSTLGSNIKSDEGVKLTSIANDDILVYNSTTGLFENKNKANYFGGATTQILRGDGSLYTFPLAISSPTNGQVLKYNGTSWVNDSDAGITGSGSAGQVAYFTGATTQTGNNNLFWDTAVNRLGVGTNNPAYRFHAISSDASIGAFRNSGAAIGQLLVGNTAGDLGIRILASGDGLIFSDTSKYLAFGTNGGTERMRLDASGNLGLGVSPSAWVGGTFKGFEIGRIGSSIYNTPSANQIGFTTNAYNDGTWKYANAGLATALSIVDGAYYWYNAPSGTAGNAITFTQAMTLTANGRLLLGTTTEGAQLLQVNGTSLLGGLTTITGSATTLLQITSTGSAAYIGMGDSSGSLTYIGSDDGAFFVQTPTNSYSTKFTISNGGSVGIGTTSPQNLLHIYGTDGNSYLRFTSNIATTGTRIGYNGDEFRIDQQQNASLTFRTNSSERMRITSSGDVGIGTSAPIARLQVATSSNTGTTSMLLLSRASGYGHTLFEQTYDSTYFTAGKTLTLKNDAGTAFVHFAGNNLGTQTNLLIPTGNIGVGVTPNTWGTAVRAIQLNAFAAVWGSSANFGGISTNFYSDNTQNRYIGVGEAALYQQGNGVHSWYTAGSGTANAIIPFVERMTLSNSGNLGLGVTPTSVFHIQRNQNATTQIDVQNTTSGTESVSRINLRSDITAGFGNISKYSSAITAYKIFSGSDFAIYNGTAGNISILNDFVSGSILMAAGGSSTAQFTIASTGAIRFNTYGTGARTGTVAYNLAVDASGNIIETAGGVVDGSGTTNYVSKWSDPNTLTNSLLYDNGSYVGINTSSPTYTLDVNGTTRINNNLYMLATAGIGTFISFKNDTNTSGFDIGHLNGANGDAYIYQRANEPLVIGTNNTERMRITSAGNVGIGTSAPLSKTHIAFQADFDGLRLQNTIRGHSYLLTTAGSTADYFSIYDLDNSQYLYQASNIGHGFLTGGVPRLAITSIGNVGIGTTTPSVLLQLQSAAFPEERITDGTIGYQMYSATTSNDFVTGTYTNHNLVFRTNATERMRISLGGNVGIGTSSPAYKLHVVTDAVAGKQNMANISRTTGNWVRFTNPQYSTDASMGLMLRVFPDSDTRQGAGIIASGGANNACTDLDLFVTSSPDGLGGTSYSALKIAGNTGYVGIATATPNYTLDLQTTSTFITHNLKVNAAAAAGNYAEIAFQLWSGATGGQNVFGGAGTSRPSVVLRALSEDANANGALVFGTFGAGATNATLTEKMRLTSAGKLLIGSTSDAGNFKLQVTGATYLNGNLSVNTTYNGFAANIQGTTYVITGHVWVNDAYGFANASSPNTGMFPDSTHNITFKNNNATSFYINSSSNVGIGTTSIDAANKLQVEGGYISVRGVGGGGGGFYTSWPNTSNTDARTWGWGSSINVFGDFGINQSNAKDGNPITAGTTRFYINNLGNVGIGTTSPLFKLDVIGGIRVNEDGSGTKVITVRSDFAGVGPAINVSTSHPLLLQTANTERMRITAAGNVGIGTSAPISMLTVDNGTNGNITSGFLMTMGSTNQSASAYGFVGTNVYGGAGNSIYALRTGYNPQFIEFAWNDAIKFHVTSSTFTAGTAITGTEKMRITASGLVGIGTTTPSSRLHISNSTSDGLTVQTTTNVEPFIAIQRNTSASNGVAVIRLLDGGSIAIDNGATGAAQSTKMTVSPTGNIGIGMTTPDTTFSTIAKGMIINGGATGNTYILFQNSTTGTTFTDGATVGINSSRELFLWNNENAILSFGTNGNEKARISADGRLMVGTSTNSTYRLDVNGTVRMNSSVLIGGVVTLSNIAGADTRIVVADASGNLSTQPTSTYLSSLSGEATNSGNVVTLTNSAVIGKVLTGLNVSSAAITSSDSILTAFGKIQGQIDGLQGGTIYKGSWNANTNTPTITSGTGTQGNYYVVTTAGTTTIDGVSSWAIGDWIIFNGTVWEKIPNVDAITSVNGQTGVVSLTTSNISEGTNLYYTDARARAAISLTTSGASGSATYNNSTGVLNIPAYTLVGLGGVATGTTITINGVSQDLSTNRTFSVGTITSIVAGSYLTGGTITSSGTIAVDATTTNTANKIVARDASGNFAAGTITANLTGTASLASQVSINYNNNSDASYQMLWGSGNSVYGTSGITCNPFTDTVNLTGTLNSGGIGVVGFGRMYGGDFWHSGTNNNGTRTETLKLGRFTDSETPAYVVYTDDTAGDILEFYSNRYTGDFRLTRNSESGLRNMMRVNSDNGGTSLDLYTGGGSTLGVKLQSNGDARFAYDVVAYYSFSDARLKTNVATIQNPLQKVMAMRGVTYEWNEGYKAGKKEIGLIAQEVMEIIPEVVAEKERVDGSKFLSVDYEHLTGLLIEAVKELKKEVDELKSK